MGLLPNERDEFKRIRKIGVDVKRSGPAGIVFPDTGARAQLGTGRGLGIAQGIAKRDAKRGFRYMFGGKR